MFIFERFLEGPEKSGNVHARAGSRKSCFVFGN